MRFWYEAFDCKFARTNMDTRFVTVLTEMMEDWKCARIHSSLWNRFWKYGAAARNIFLRGCQYMESWLTTRTYHAQSIATPSMRNTEYSSHENGTPSGILVRVSSSPSSVPSPTGVYSWSSAGFAKIERIRSILSMFVSLEDSGLHVSTKIS